MEGAITALIAGVPVAAVEIEHDPVEIYSNGVRHVKVPDRDGNAITFRSRRAPRRSRTA